MTKNILGTLLVASALMATVKPAKAEEPGTNIPTPPVTNNTNTANTDVPPFASQPGVVAPEPVIDTKTTTTTFPNRPLLITGLVLLGGSYGASAIVAATSDRKADDKLYYPVAGPWMDLNDRNCDVNACPNKTTDKILLIGDGVLQGLGALTLVMSLFIPEKTTRHWYLIGHEGLTLTPQVGRSVTGLAAVGSF
jgi:hypothetical protein